MEVLEQSACELEKEIGGKVPPVTCDVMKYQEVENVLSKKNAQFGRVDGVLNNAASNLGLSMNQVKCHLTWAVPYRGCMK